MHFVYIDDSGDGTVACFSALIIAADQWRDGLDHLLAARRAMRQTDGVYIKQELHSTDWNAGKGRLSKKPITKQRRVEMYNDFLAAIASTPSCQLINACVPLKQQTRAFEWLLNRIDTNMRHAGSRCVIFCDEGKDYDTVRRKIGVYNPIPSRLGTWEDGNASQNLPTHRILEDLVYRDSAKSIYVQAADACAYALLRRERPLASKNALGLDQSFYLLEPVMVKAAYAKDPYGIIR
jgi:hypothetical protein